MNAKNISYFPRIFFFYTLEQHAGKKELFLVFSNC